MSVFLCNRLRTRGRRSDSDRIHLEAGKDLPFPVYSHDFLSCLFGDREENKKIRKYNSREEAQVCLVSRWLQLVGIRNIRKREMHVTLAYYYYIVQLLLLLLLTT